MRGEEVKPADPELMFNFADICCWRCARSKNHMKDGGENHKEHTKEAGNPLLDITGTPLDGHTLSCL